MNGKMFWVERHKGEDWKDWVMFKALNNQVVGSICQNSMLSILGYLLKPGEKKKIRITEVKP